MLNQETKSLSNLDFPAELADSARVETSITVSMIPIWPLHLQVRFHLLHTYSLTLQKTVLYANGTLVPLQMLSSSLIQSLGKKADVFNPSPSPSMSLEDAG